MVFHIVTAPPGPEILHPPGKADVEVVPMSHGTWSKPDVLAQYTKGPEVPTGRPEPPADPAFHVQPVPYNTGFKSGQLIKLVFPQKNMPINGINFF